MVGSFDRVRVIDTAMESRELDIIEGEGTARALLWSPEVTRFRSFHALKLHNGAQTVVLRHPSDCVYYVAEGQGDILDAGTQQAHSIGPGSVVHIDRGDSYRLRANAGEAMVILGGPCPPDPSLYKPSTRPAA